MATLPAPTMATVCPGSCSSTSASSDVMACSCTAPSSSGHRPAPRRGCLSEASASSAAEPTHKRMQTSAVCCGFSSHSSEAGFGLGTEASSQVWDLHYQGRISCAACCRRPGECAWLSACVCLQLSGPPPLFCCLPAWPCPLHQAIWNTQLNGPMRSHTGLHIAIQRSVPMSETPVSASSLL